MKWQEDIDPGVKFKSYLNTFTRAGKPLPVGKKAVKNYQLHFNFHTIHEDG